ncbi:MAG: sugar ABC transporter permease [Cellulomonas sp.]|nr:sugar ABC transporter permease [Cellulomonas sp.]
MSALAQSAPLSHRDPAPTYRRPLWPRVQRIVTPYLYLLPTVLLLVVLMLVPIAMVVGYSFQDNVITNPNPVFVGLANYGTVLSDPVFLTAVKNTAYFTGVSVAAHMVLGLAFAMMLNSPLLANRTKALFRTVYVLPWLFTVAIIAVLWRMLLNPTGVVNYLLTAAGLIT